MSDTAKTTDDAASWAMRPLGRHGLRVGPLAVGTAPLGNLFTEVPDDVWPGVVPAAYAGGVRLFDTAPHYGLGLAERRLGQSLHGLPRTELIISTKIGRVLEPRPNPDGARDDEGFDVPADVHRVRDYSRDGVLRSIEDSLTRLGLDAVDLVLVHDPDDHYREALDQAFPALAELQSQGVIRSYGAGMNQSAMLTRFVERTDLDVVLLAGRYTLLDTSALSDLLPACVERDVSVIAAGVFNSGVLATDQPSASATYDYAPASAGVLSRAAALAEVCARHGAELPAAALAFPLAHPAVRTVCVGVRSADEITRNLRLLATPIPAGLWSELADANLIPAP